MQSIRIIKIDEIEGRKEELLALLSKNGQGKELLEEIAASLKDKGAVLIGGAGAEGLIGLLWGQGLPFRSDNNRFFVRIYTNGNTLSLLRLLDEAEAYAKQAGFGTVYFQIEAEAKTESLIAKGYIAERIQLAKRNLRYQKGDNEVIPLDHLMIKKYHSQLTELFLLNAKAHILSENFDRAWAEEKITDLVSFAKQGKARVWGYVIENQPVGFLWVFPFNWQGEEIYMTNAITVKPEFRNRHIADKLFGAMEQQLFAEGKAVHTLVDGANEIAYNFYQKNGMTDVMYQLAKQLN